MKKITTKAIQVNESEWKKLWKLRVDKGFKNMAEVVAYALSFVKV